jgi:sulfite reductase alpha subunit-like flavoprotein
VERGLGDDRSPLGVAGDFDAWCGTRLWPALDALHPLPEGAAGAVVQGAQLLRLRLRVRVVGDDEEGVRAEVRERERRLLGGGPSPLEATAAEAEAVGKAPDRTAHPPSSDVCRVLENNRLTAQAWAQDVRHITLDLAGTGLRYAPGDIAVVRPRNPAEEVEALAARLGVDLDAVVEITPRGDADGGFGSGGDLPAPAPFPSSTYTGEAEDARATLTSPGRSPASASSPSPLPRLATVRHLLTDCVDICGVPRRGLMEQLSFFAGDEEEREKLAEMATASGADLFHSFCVSERRTLREVLDDFVTVRLPLAHLLDHLPPLQPRHFSIASAPSDRPGALSLCVAVVAYATKFGRPKRGLCSTYLAGLRVGDAVRATVRSAQLSAAYASVLCDGTGRPAVLVGPGTGFAPMRSVWRGLRHERRLREGRVVGEGGLGGGPVADSDAAAAADAVSAPAVAAAAAAAAEGKALVPGGGDVLMFFGCRKQSSDWLYGEETSAAAMGESEEGPDSGIALYDVAFSRDAVYASFVPDEVLYVPVSMSSSVITTSSGRVYVQSRLAAFGRHVADALVRRGGCLFIAGSAQKMPTEVLATVREILRVEGGLGDGVDAYMARMERDKRLVVEAWS